MLQLNSPRRFTFTPHGDVCIYTTCQGPGNQKKEQPAIKQVKAKPLSKKQQKAEARRKAQEMAAIAEKLGKKSKEAEVRDLARVARFLY